MKKLFLTAAITLCCTQIAISQSPLSTGTWFKIAVVDEGAYCVTFNDLVTLGINPQSIDPRNISLFGNRSGRLPIQNNVSHPGDIDEMAISVIGESDGVFDQGDSIIFYGQSQTQWLPDLTNNRFTHFQNIYSDSTYYFLTIGNIQGKRISPVSSLPSFTNSTSTFTDFLFHEMDSVNLVRCGKAWYGELINAQASRNFNFNVTNISPTSPLYIYAEFEGRVTVGFDTGVFSITCNGTTVSKSVSRVGTNLQDPLADTTFLGMTVPGPIVNGNVECNFQSADATARGWLNYIEVNLSRTLALSSPQQIFSDLSTIGTGSITKYILSDVFPDVKVWNVTDPLNVSEQQLITNFPAAEFTATHDSVTRYVAVNGGALKRPTMIGAVPNQDLHSFTNADMVVVTDEHFLTEASTLAAFHQTNDNIHSVVVTTSQIYNEYSTGSPDPVAIRDFIRQTYQRTLSPTDTLKYVLLFGGGSYDYKNRLGSFSSFIPFYQSKESLCELYAFVTDDFYSYLGDNASDLFSDSVYVGVGRIPVKNSTDALAINKIISYSSAPTLGDWRKKITYVAENFDMNTHLKQTDTIANRVENSYCEYNQRKIYLNDYERDSLGHFPGAVADIADCIQNGCLTIQYTGHSSNDSWAFSRILQKPFLESVINNNNLPLFIAITADFNRFDDPLDTSGGQVITLRQFNGGIACIGHSRISFSSSNYNFAQRLNKFLFEKENNVHLRLGDIFKKAKQGYHDQYVLGFTLLGDPALRLNYPTNDVFTTMINGHAPGIDPDTLVPGQSLSLAGEIHDPSGNIISSFNGVVSVVVFDQKTLHVTLPTDTFQSPVTFYFAYDDTLCFGSLPVTAGTFSNTFIIPYDVDSGIVNGKISYYARDASTDASSCYENFVYHNLNPMVSEIYADVTIVPFPNPSRDKIEFSISGVEGKDLVLTLTDLNGRIISRKETTQNRFYVERSGLSSGTYFYEVRDLKNVLVKRGKIVFE